MATVCPNCGKNTIRAGIVVVHAIPLRGPLSSLVCPNCGGRSFVELNKPSSWWALAILGLALFASYPTGLSQRYLSAMRPFFAAAIRLEIWAIAILVAFFVYAFGGPLAKLDAGAVKYRRVAIFLFPVRLLFLLSLALYGYYLLRQLPHAP